MNDNNKVIEILLDQQKVMSKSIKELADAIHEQNVVLTGVSNQLTQIAKSHAECSKEREINSKFVQDYKTRYAMRQWMLSSLWVIMLLFLGAVIRPSLDNYIRTSNIQMKGR